MSYRRIIISGNGLGFFVLSLTVALFSGCKSQAQDPQPEIKASLFPPESACRYPVSAPGKLFNRLGGGQWSPADENAAESRFECRGSTPVVQLTGDANGSILVEYSATGDREGASMVKLVYKAEGVVSHETTYRNTFANLAEVITKTALETPPPELFRRKVMNLESYSTPGKNNDETFDAGRGFVLLNRERVSGSSNITVTVRVYSDTAFKLRP